MLSSANRDLIARDGNLPGLVLLLDPPALLAMLQAHWPKLELSGFEPTYLRYKPATSCLAGFRLTVNGAPTWLTFTARRLDALDKLEKVLLKTGRPGPFGPGRKVFPEFALTMACFPNDRALRRVWKLSGSRAKPAGLADLGMPHAAKLVPLRYRPERRFVGRVDHQGSPLAVLKVHAPDAFARAVGNAAAFESSGLLIVPRMLGAEARYGAIACEWLCGSPAGTDPTTAHRIGQALALLHRQDARQLAALTLSNQQASARTIAADLAALLPDLAARVKALAAQIAYSIDCGASPVSLHGDCHLEQVIELGSKIALVDFDEAARGPAAWDLGNLLAHLEADGQPDEVLSAFSVAMLDGYRAAGGTIGERELASQTALGLLRLALRPFREQQPDWPAAIATILARAEAACLSTAPSGRVDPDLPQLAAALDPELASAAFADAGLPVSVTSTRLVRHKSGRRCLIAYELIEPSGRQHAAFGKLRAKGADSRVFALQQELWNDGFGPGGWSAARVSQPLALVPSLGLWLQAAVPGQPFAVETCLPELAARTIGALHKARIRPLKRHLLDDELAILGTRLISLAERKPEWAERLGSLLKATQRIAAQATPVALRPIHRDFYHDHLIQARDCIHLIDLDLLCLGDPAVDIGNFNAHLTELALREHGDPDLFAWWQVRFASAACRSPHGAQPVNVRIYEMLSLVRLVEIADRMPERRGTCEVLLMHCEMLAEANPVRSRRPQ